MIGFSAARAITQHYKGDWHGDHGLFPTPGHSKSDRGMSVKDADDGDVLLHSFNGGDWRDVKAECRRLGLLPERPSLQRPDEPWRVTGTYEYRNGDGSIAYRTVRQERVGSRKRFMAQRPDGRGGWISGLARDAVRVLYRLPEIQAAIERTVLRDEAMPTVYLVEGERKADKLVSWGLLATAVAFGANGWRDSYAKDLAGCTVIILPDNDDEGRGFAGRASESLTKAGAQVTVLSLPGLPPKGDVMDWAGDQAALRKLTEQALNGAVESFAVADLAAWASTPPAPKTFAMAGVVPSGEVTLFTGPGGANKSTFGLQLCACAAAGLPMLGVDVAPAKTLYLTAEDDDRENHWRLSKIAKHLGVGMDNLVDRLHVASVRGRLGNELATFDGDGRMHVAPAYRLLDATLRVTGAKLIVLDNVGHLYIGNENDRGQVTAFVNLLYQLCRDHDATVVLIAHPNKAGDSYSGSTAWLNAVRSQIVIQRAEGSDPDARILSLGKANYARPDHSIAFRWHDFALARDEDLSAGQRTENAANARANHDNDVFLACLAERIRQKRAVSEKRGPTFAPTEFAKMVESKSIGKDRLEKAMDRLFRIDKIRRAELWKGSDRKPVFGLCEAAGNGAGNTVQERG